MTNDPSESSMDLRFLPELQSGSWTQIESGSEASQTITVHESSS